MHWSERLKGWLDERGWKAPQLARASGVEVDTLYKWLRGSVESPRKDDLVDVLAVLGRSEIELFHGVQSGRVADLGDIPLLYLNRLGELKRGQKPRELWDGESTVTTTMPVGENAFGLLLDRESGLVAHTHRDADDFRPGDVVIIEPDKPPVPGRNVLAIDEVAHKALFGRFRPLEVGSKEEFSVLPPNPDHPKVTIDDDRPGFIVGPATKLIRDI